MDKKINVLIDRDKIAKRVGELADELAESYKDQKPVVIGILGGSFIFLADLVRKSDFASELDFIWLESYEGTHSTGKIGVRQDIRVDVTGKDVLLVDDILDTGLTLQFTKDLIKERGAKSVQAAVLVRKDRKEGDPHKAEHVGFVIPDRFVVGYGLDYNGRYRHLPDLCVLNPKAED